MRTDLSTGGNGAGSTARPGTRITTFGRDTATANTEFQRIGAAVTGRQSHVWLRTAQGWRIAAAHVSLMPPAAAR